VKKTVLGVLTAAATMLGSAAFAQAPAGYDPQSMGQPPAMPEPPPPPEAQAAPPAYAAPQAYAAPAPSGQWVYTNQYGWVWMPYGESYTYVTANEVAYTYAYYPRFGWRWISSPWVVGYGPSPFWGRLGPVHFAWYGHPRFHGYASRGAWSGRPVYHAAAPAAWHGRFGHGGWRHR
jgi:hypothetical protein